MFYPLSYYVPHDSSVCKKKKKKEQDKWTTGKGQHIINCAVFTLDFPDIIKMRWIYFSLISDSRSQADHLPQPALVCCQRVIRLAGSHSCRWLFQTETRPSRYLHLLTSLGQKPTTFISTHWRGSWGEEKKKNNANVLGALPFLCTLPSSFFCPSSAYWTCDNNDEHYLCKCN